MKYTCIICPLSCDMELLDQAGPITVSGHSCPRGKAYALSEYTHPKRMVTSTVKITGGKLPRLPVISSGPIDKQLLPEALKIIYKTVATAPVKMGDIIIKNIYDTGVDMIASRDMESSEGNSIA